MTPEQALKILIEATRFLDAKRDQHLQILEALRVISEKLKLKEEASEKSVS